MEEGEEDGEEDAVPPVSIGTSPSSRGPGSSPNSSKMTHTSATMTDSGKSSSAGITATKTVMYSQQHDIRLNSRPQHCHLGGDTI